jgi:hypothetical protein
MCQLYTKKSTKPVKIDNEIQVKVVANMLNQGLS